MNINKNTITGRVYKIAFELLENHPEGMNWSQLLKEIKIKDQSIHPKTINGCVWKMVEKFPDKVYKPSKGLFKLRKFENFSI